MSHATTARWTNWSRTATSTPREVLSPGAPDQVQAAVLAAVESGSTLKMIGSGHSFTEIATTGGTMLRPDEMRGVLALDEEAMTVTAAAGTQLKVLNATLAEMGLSLHNMGDIAEQTLAGAVSTGTHGSGGVVAAGLAPQLAGFSMVTGTGEHLSANATENADIFEVGRVGLGALGILTSLTFKVEPAFLLQANEQPMTWSALVDGFDELIAENHHVDAHWFPHTDSVLFKGNNRLSADLSEAEPQGRFRAWMDEVFLSNTVFGVTNRLANRVPSVTPTLNGVAGKLLGAKTYSDLAHKVFVSPRTVRFKEMEYALPYEAGMAALREVRALVDRSEWRISFPVEVRTARADDVPMSTGYGRDSVYLAFHVHVDADHTGYFAGVEEIMKAHGGRPHWGKMNTRTAEDLAPVYPRFDDFLAMRDRLDPHRVFANDYLRRVLGD